MGGDYQVRDEEIARHVGVAGSEMTGDGDET